MEYNIAIFKKDFWKNLAQQLFKYKIKSSILYMEYFLKI